MLVLKKISTKKLVISLVIIVLMLGGIGFVLYQNQKLTGSKSVVVDGSAPYDELIAEGVVAPGSQASSSQPMADPLLTAKITNNDGLDLTIFSSQKFQALKENILIPQENLGLGKRDLFKPN